MNGLGEYPRFADFRKFVRGNMARVGDFLTGSSALVDGDCPRNGNRDNIKSLVILKHF
jgi:hypothetical protein